MPGHKHTRSSQSTFTEPNHYEIELASLHGATAYIRRRVMVIDPGRDDRVGITQDRPLKFMCYFCSGQKMANAPIVSALWMAVKDLGRY